jgi:hypothetical protein
MTDRLPFIFRGAKALNLTRVEVFARVKPQFVTTTHAPDKLKISFSEKGAAALALAPPVGLVGWNGVLRDACVLGKPNCRAHTFCGSSWRMEGWWRMRWVRCYSLYNMRFSVRKTKGSV